jgi:predicted nucleotidyltransferase component of viral defense system
MSPTGFREREAVQLLLLRQLASRFARTRYALKGGACLRFYFQSPRFSEDMDLDVAGLRRDRTEKLVDEVFASPSFLASMRTRGISELRVQPKSRQKQTETTQRWKLSVVLPSGLEVFSKLEISRRDDPGAAPSGVPSAERLREHDIEPFVARHYHAPRLAETKVRALAEPRRQACRDLFDLAHLLRYAGVRLEEAVRRIPPAILETAREKVFAYDVARFEAEVFPFLPPDLARHFLDGDWEKAQLEVAEALDRARGRP